jgi:SLOG cluster2
MTNPIHPAPSDSPLPLEAWRVGLSISDSPDLASLGFGQMHIEDAFVECSRHLLAGGATLAYGGDLRERGYTKILFDVARTHLRSAISPSERIASFLAWPLHLKLTASGRAELKKVAQFFLVEPPEDLRVDPQSYLEPASPENSYVWARCLTRMREMINDQVNARVLLGGKTDDKASASRLPLRPSPQKSHSLQAFRPNSGVSAIFKRLEAVNVCWSETRQKSGRSAAFNMQNAGRT